jgi:hypothetical protein
MSRHHIDGIANQFSAARFQNQSRHQVARQNVDSKSAPRSNRCEASVCSPCRRDVLRTVTGSHHADSIRIFRVLSVIMVSNPPITPAKSDGLFRVGHHQIFRSQRAFHAIQRLQLLAILRLSNDELAAFEQIHVEDMRRLAHLPQNVIGGIDGIADRPLVEQLQAPRNLFRRGFDLRSANNPRREARTKLRLLHLIGKGIVRRILLMAELRADSGFSGKS